MSTFQYWARWIAFGVIFTVVFLAATKWFLVNPIIDAIYATR